jgi:glycerol-3-phosphate acyltransferase PlsY
MLVILFAYIIGAIPGGYLVNRILQNRKAARSMPVADAQHAARLERMIPALASIFADAAKGALAVYLVPKLAAFCIEGGWQWIVYPFIPQGFLNAAVLVIVVLGHVFSVFICGWGGKGTAVTLGGFMVLAPKITLYALALFLPVTLTTGTILYASLIACCSLPILILICEPSKVPLLVSASILAVLSIITHYRDVTRHRGSITKP